MQECQISVATIDDIGDIAHIHKLRFSGHFLAKYSENLLAAYYQTFLTGCVFLVCRSNTGLEGFVLGGASRDLASARKDFLKKNKWLYITETLLKPGVYLEALARLIGIISSLLLCKDPSLEKTEDITILLSIAVREQGNGIAQTLCNAFEKAIIPASVYRLYVRKDNERALAFYRKIGFEITDTIGNEYAMDKHLNT